MENAVRRADFFNDEDCTSIQSSQTPLITMDSYEIPEGKPSLSCAELQAIYTLVQRTDVRQLRAGPMIWQAESGRHRAGGKFQKAPRCIDNGGS